MGLAGGYAAGGVKDALLEIVKQRMLEQELAQREEEQQFQRTRQRKQDARADEQTQYTRGRDALADQVAAEGRTRQAGLDQRAEAKDQLAAMQGRPFTELVDPATQGLNEKATPAVGLPPLPGTNVMGVSPPAVRQGKVRSVRIGDEDVKPSTREDERQLLDEASARTVAEREASRVPKGPPDVGSFEDYVLRTYGRNPSPQQIVQARKDYGQADDSAQRPPVPVVILGPNGPMLVNRNDGTGRAVQEVGPGGQPTGVNIGNKLPPSVIDKVGNLDSVITGVNDMIALKNDAWLGPIMGYATKGRLEIPGMDVPQDLADFAALTSTIRNATIKAITGAQMSEQEAKRIKEQIPDFTDKPTVWMANAKATIKNLSELRAKMLALSGAQSDTVGVSGARAAGTGQTTPAAPGGKMSAADLIKKYGG
jgi:hypothetical protein